MFWGCLCLAMTTWNQFRSICHFFILVWLSPNTIQCWAIYLCALACVLGKCKCILTSPSTIQNKEDKWTSRNIAHFIPIPKQIVSDLFLSLAQVIMSWLNADMFASDSIGYLGEIGDNMSMTLDGSMYPPVEILHKTSSLRSNLFFFFSHATYADYTRLPWNLYPLLYWHLPYISGFVKCSCFALFLYYVRALKITFSYAFSISSIVPNTEVLLNNYLLVDGLILLTLLVAAPFLFNMVAVQCNYWWLGNQQGLDQLESWNQGWGWGWGGKGRLLTKSSGNCIS